MEFSIASLIILLTSSTMNWFWKHVTVGYCTASIHFDWQVWLEQLNLLLRPSRYILSPPWFRLERISDRNKTDYWQTFPKNNEIWQSENLLEIWHVFLLAELTEWQIPPFYPYKLSLCSGLAIKRCLWFRDVLYLDTARQCISSSPISNVIVRL